MSDNDLIDIEGFDTTADGAQQPLVEEHGGGAQEQTEQAANKNQVILQLIDQNRQSGLKRLTEATEKLDELKGLNTDPLQEERLREIEAGLRATATCMEAVDTLTNIIRQDLVNTIVNLEKFTKMNMHQGMHLQTLIELLQRKELVTPEELEDTWNSLVPSAPKIEG